MYLSKLVMSVILIVMFISCNSKNCTVCQGVGENTCIVCIDGNLNNEICNFCVGKGEVSCSFCKGSGLNK